MTIGLIDPALLLPRESALVAYEIDLVLEACRHHTIRLPPISDYWGDLWAKFGPALEKSLSPQHKRPLQMLRNLGNKDQDIPRTNLVRGKVWKNGFEQLFASINGESWTDRMAAAVLRALAVDHDVVLFTRKMVGRNEVSHRAGNSTLSEITRWVLHTQPKGLGHRQILCVHHPRNLEERWTARFDWRLPAAGEGARYPFCPPDNWWKRDTIAHRTVESKPCWIDKKENAWARPNIGDGTGYHWDVFIHSATVRQSVGLDQLNIVEHGAPAAEGKAGDIHHTPAKKRSALRDVGWVCV